MDPTSPPASTSPKAALDAAIAAALALLAGGDVSGARDALARLRADAALAALPPVTALGLNRRLHAALLRLAKAQDDPVARAGLQFHLVPPPAVLQALTQASADDRRRAARESGRAIPRVLHQIWIGPLPVPDAAAAWAAHARTQGYAYRLWREADLAAAGHLDDPLCRAMLARGDHPGAVDVLRYHIMAREGGIYLDCDWYPARDDLGFHDLIALRGLAAMAETVPRQTSAGGLLLANSFIAVAPGHPAMHRLLAVLPKIAERLPGAPAWWTTGPLPFTLVARGGALTLADAGIVAASLPRRAPPAAIAAAQADARARDRGLLIACKSW